MLQQKPIDELDETTGGGSDSPSESEKKARPTHAYPTLRLKFAKQLDVLRGFASVSGMAGKPVKNTEVEKVTGIAAETISLCNAFFAEIGLLQKFEGSGYIPSPEVISFHRANEWSPDTAAHRLQPAFQKSWIWDALGRKLDFGALTEDKAIATLGEESSGSTHHRAQLKLILDYLEAVGLIRKEGNQILKNKHQQIPQDAEIPKTMIPNQPEPRTTATQKVSVIQGLPTLFDGAVQFSVTIKVDMAEFSGWEPARILAFFQGIAQVLSAKANVEVDGNNE